MNKKEYVKKRRELILRLLYMLILFTILVWLCFGTLILYAQVSNEIITQSLLNESYYNSLSIADRGKIVNGTGITGFGSVLIVFICFILYLFWINPTFKAPRIVKLENM